MLVEIFLSNETALSILKSEIMNKNNSGQKMYKAEIELPGNYLNDLKGWKEVCLLTDGISHHENCGISLNDHA